MNTTVSLPSEKESLILDAAQKRFTQYGLTKVTMDEIAADIGMGKASLYYYFPTKEDLFRSVVRREQERFLSHIQSILYQKISATEKLKRYVTHRNRFFAGLFDHRLLEFAFLQNPKPSMSELFMTFAEEELAMLTEILRQGHEQTELMVPDLHATATLLLHVLQGLRLRHVKESALRPELDSQSADLRQETLLFLDIFVHGIARSKLPA